MCPAPEHTTHTREKKVLCRCAGPMAERDRTRMKTASVTSIIVMLHFIVGNGNSVVTGETLIRLITHY